MFLSTIFRPKVTSEREVTRYVVSVTAFALGCFLAIDVPNHLLFFTRWSDYWRDWSIDAAACVTVAVPVLRSIGSAHLHLYFAKREAERLNLVDPLTGLANRRALYETAETIGGGPIALVIADIDYFKRINDTYGHLGGDAVIQRVGEVLRDELADLGEVARVGGEEFALICVEREPTEIRARLARVRMALAQTPTLLDGERVFVTLSFGLATGAGETFNELYASADKALYVAKASGRDRTVEFDEIAPDIQPAGWRRAG